MSGATNEIKQLILDQYRSEAAFAAHLNWSRQRLNKITNGVRLPTIDEVNTLSHELDVPVDRLIHIFLAQ